MPRLILLPGFMGGASSWGAVRESLPPEIEARAVELPGHGPNPIIPSVRGFRDNIDALMARVVPKRRGLHGDVIVGYSMGARLALAIALGWPDYFAEVIAVGADLGLSDPTTRLERVVEDEERASRLEQDGLVAFVDEWEKLPLFATQARVSTVALEGQRATRLGHTRHGLAFALRTVGTGAMPDLRPELARTSLAISFVAGAEDPKFLALAEEGSRLVSRGQQLIVPDAGHNVPLEAPRALAAVIAERVWRASERARRGVDENQVPSEQMQTKREEPRHE